MNLKPLKICQISLSLGKGGAERSCALLSRMLQNQGHEVHTVILTDVVDYEYAGKLFNLGKLKTDDDGFLKRLPHFKKLRNYLKKNRFDVIIDHRPKNNYWREVFYDKYLYRGLNRIYIIHSSLLANYFTDNPPKMVAIYNKSSANIAVSEYILQKVKNRGVQNCVQIHNAFDPDWEKSARQLPEKLKGKTYLLWYGRINNTVKDLFFLLDAFETSELWKKSIRLVIMGEGKDSEKIKDHASGLACREQLIFLPFQKNPFSCISAARATVLTSKYEGFPMVLLESLSVGTPVVSLDIKSGPSEVIEHQKNGLLVSERNRALFAEAMQEICLNEVLYQTCKKNTKFSVARFSMEKIGRKWEKLLQDRLR